jgi:hypothetical protein
MTEVVKIIEPDPPYDAGLEIERFLRAHLSKSAYEYWKFVNTEIPPCFHLASSSSGKYHKGSTNVVNTIGEHTLEMLQAAYSCGLRIFNLQPGDLKADIILLAIALHDRCKRGRMNDQVHTTNDHETIIADFIQETSMDWFDVEHRYMLEDMVRWHSGRWAPANPNRNTEPNWNKYSLFIHTLDMMSANRRFVLDK